MGSFSSTPFSRAGGLPHTTAPHHPSYLGAHVPGKPFPAFSVLTAAVLSELGFLLLVQVLPGKEGKGKRQESFIILCNENGYSREIGRRGTPRCCRPSASAPRNPDGNSPPPSADAHLSLRATPRGNTITSVSRMRSPARRITHSWGVAGGSPIQTSWLQSPRAFPRPPASVRSGYTHKGPITLRGLGSPAHPTAPHLCC